MGAGASAGGKNPRGMFSPDEMTMHKIRSRSDTCLHAILTQELLETEFERFMSEDMNTKTPLIQFWKEAEDFRETKFRSMKELDAEAKRLFETFCGEDATQNVFLDAPTMETLKMALTCADERTFMYAAEKVYQQLKFEALPRFLISERFKTLENKHQKLWPTREMVSAIEEVEILSVLMEPKGMEKMQEYYTVRGDEKKVMALKLWHQIQCFREAYDATEEAMDEMDEFAESNAEKACSLYRMCQGKIVVPEDILEAILEKYPTFFSDILSKKQTNTIIRRPSVTLEPLNEDVLADLQSVTLDEAEPGPHVFDELQTHLFDIMNEEFSEFKASPHYAEFTMLASGSFRLNSALVLCRGLKTDRNLDEVRTSYQEALTQSTQFESLFEDTLLSVFFKRFSRLQHFEESFLFLIDMHALRVEAGKPLNERERRETMDSLDDDEGFTPRTDRSNIFTPRTDRSNITPRNYTPRKSNIVTGGSTQSRDVRRTVPADGTGSGEGTPDRGSTPVRGVSPVNAPLSGLEQRRHSFSALEQSPVHNGGRKHSFSLSVQTGFAPLLAGGAEEKESTPVIEKGTPGSRARRIRDRGERETRESLGDEPPVSPTSPCTPFSPFSPSSQEYQFPGNIPGTPASRVPNVRAALIADGLTNIFEKYIKAGSKYEISCSDRDREKAQGLIEYSNRRSFSVDMFIDIERDMMAKLRTDAFSRFLKSNLYDHYKHAHYHKFAVRNFVAGNNVQGRGMQGGRSKLNKML